MQIASSPNPDEPYGSSGHARPTSTHALLAGFERCPRLSWLMRHRPDAAKAAAADGGSRLATAKAVKAEAQRQCTGAVAIDHHRGWASAIAATRRAVAERRTVLHRRSTRGARRGAAHLLRPRRRCDARDP